MTAAFFDVDGTVTHTNIVMYYFAYRVQTLRGLKRAAWVAGFGLKCIGFFISDLIDRSIFNRWFYRSYGGIEAEKFRAWCDETFATITRPRIFPDAERVIREHREAGRRIVFVTGGIEETVRPLARHLGVEEVIANRLEVRDGRFTGRLVGDPIACEAKVDAMQASGSDTDLADSFAYSDSVSDLAMLLAVGHPVAVNPGPGLRLKARRAGWPIETWALNGGTGSG